MTSTILITGGAGYIGSHAAYILNRAGYRPVVIDNLSTGNLQATASGLFEQGDIGNTSFVRTVIEKYCPVAALHFAAFIEVGESTQKPGKYFENNRDKSIIFFKTLQDSGVKNIIFSSTAAVYGESAGNGPLLEEHPTLPINPYGQSKLEAETFLRSMDTDGVHSVALRYFNVGGAAPLEAKIGEAHYPETHLIPRLILPLIDTPPSLLDFLGLQNGFTVYGNDYPTPDGTAIRDYIHVMDLVDAHIRALDYLLKGGKTDFFNLGNGQGFSVEEIVDTTRKVLNRPDFTPKLAPRRAGDPAVLIASCQKACEILGWKSTRSLEEIIMDAARWHQSPHYRAIIQTKFNNLIDIAHKGV